MKELEQLRAEIDDIDSRLVSLLLERLRRCDAIAEVKEEQKTAVCDPLREEAVLKRLTEGLDQTDADDVAKLYIAMFEVSRARQKLRLRKNK